MTKKIITKKSAKVKMSGKLLRSGRKQFKAAPRMYTCLNGFDKALPRRVNDEALGCASCVACH